MSGREHPEWMYSTRDAKSVRIAELEARIRELEAALLDSNNLAARLAEELRRERKP